MVAVPLDVPFEQSAAVIVLVYKRDSTSSHDVDERVKTLRSMEEDRLNKEALD
jgi:hypothetical protein